MAGTCVWGFHTECACASSERVPLTVVPMGRVCGTGIGMACTHVIVDTCRPSASPTTVSENASHAKSGS